MGKGEVVIVPEFDGARPREPAEVTLRKLQAFWAVAHAGSLTRAARFMGVTQPSLSQQMAGFEALAGSPLFDRRSNVMHLTEVGRRLLDRAEPVLRALRDFETELASLQGAPRNHAPHCRDRVGDHHACPRRGGGAGRNVRQSGI